MQLHRGKGAREVLYGMPHLGIEVQWRLERDDERGCGTGFIDRLEMGLRNYANVKNFSIE